MSVISSKTFLAFCESFVGFILIMVSILYSLVYGRFCCYCCCCLFCFLVINGRQLLGALWTWYPGYRIIVY